MQKVIVNIPKLSDANLFIKMVEQMSFVESVNLVDNNYNWINPNRPATDEEIEKMIIEAESTSSIAAEDAREYSLTLEKKWSKTTQK